MAKSSLGKRGRKFVKRFSKVSGKARAESKAHVRDKLLRRLSHIRNIRLLVLEWVLLALVVIVIGVAQAFWFVNTYARDEFVEGGSFVEATLGKVNSMNPLFATTSSEKVLSKLMFATLTQVDYTGQVGPGLAQSLRASEDGMVWTVKLKENLKWSDGEPLTVDDVMFTIGLIQNPLVNTIYGANLENVKVTLSETGEVVFRLPSEYADFASALEFPIVPKHELEDAQLKTLIEDDFSNAPVGSGAFVFNAAQVTTKSDEEVIYLSANANYYMGMPMLGSFVVHTYDSKDEIVAAVNSGAVTGTAELDGEDAARVSTGAFDKRLTPINVGAFAFFNTSKGILKNVEMRRAIMRGVDWDEAIQAAPDREAIKYPILSAQLDGVNYPAIIGHDVNAARGKIAELGGGGVGLEIAVVRSGYLPEVAERIRGQLAELGFDARLNIYDETQEFVANVIAKRSYDILVYEVEMGADPDATAYYHSSQASESGLNLSNYRNNLADDLLIGARETLDTELRRRKYESFLEYWVADVPAVGLYRVDLVYFYNKNTRVYNEEWKIVDAEDRFVDVGNWAVSRGIRNLTP